MKNQDANLHVQSDDSDSLDPTMYDAFDRNRQMFIGKVPGNSSLDHKKEWISKFVDRLQARLEKNTPFELTTDRDPGMQAFLLGELILRLFKKNLRHRRLSFVCRNKGKIVVTLGTVMGKGGAA